MAKIFVQKSLITVLNFEEQDYISLTDMASAKEGRQQVADVIKNRIRSRYTIKFLGTCEVIHNPKLKVVEFDHFRKSAGLPSFVLSASEWIERTNAVGIIMKKERYGGIMENLNAVFIEQGMSQGECLVKLNQIAIHQMRVLENDGDRKLLK